MQRFLQNHKLDPIKLGQHGESTLEEDGVGPDLRHLSRQDIDLIDTVIQRAGPSATTFFTIFKAYSEVIKELGYDPQEATYYKKLLKLGTLKGKNWGEKWAMVKSQLAQPQAPSSSNSPSESDFNLGLITNTQLTNQTRTNDARLIYALRTTNLAHAKSQRPTNSSGTSEKMNLFQPGYLPETARISEGTHRPDTPTTADNFRGSSPVPPSYKSAHPDFTISPSFHQAIESIKTRPAVAVASKEIIRVEERPRPVDLDEAWKNIKLEQDEKFADRFREDTLLVRCWEMWRQVFLWIVTTHRQIGEARDNVLLRIFFRRWQARLASRRKEEDNLVKSFDNYREKFAFKNWKVKFQKRRQIAWRNDMRQKMKIVKNQSELRLKKDAWAKWRQLQLSHQADKHCQLSLIARYYFRWKQNLRQLDTAEVHADEFLKMVNIKLVRRYWDHWKQASTLRDDENILVQKINKRIILGAFDLWRKRFSQLGIADDIRKLLVKKHAIHNWKKSLKKLHVMNYRAERNLHLQDQTLLRAIFRIWRARMRVTRFEIFRGFLTQKIAWQSWKERIATRKGQMEMAIQLHNKSGSRLLADSLRRWSRVTLTHRNAHAYAVNFNDTRIRATFFLLWRLRCREHLQLSEVAHWGHKYFTTRRIWRVWLAALEERKRREKLKVWNRRRTGKFLNIWRSRTQKQIYFRQCEFTLKERKEKRILSAMLAHWTNRVIEIKSLELDVSQQYAIALQRYTFQKWKLCRRQHVEELSLLENYLLVKREDTLRRTFYKWLTGKRSVEHRRLTHERKEAQIRRLIITSAWEKWRERFKEESLREKEYEVILQNQKNILAHAFNLWLSQIRSLPAVRFHSRHLKEKAFKKWRNVMPHILRAKAACDADRNKTIAKYFRKWIQAYKTKTTLKAVARAKYLRLPAASSRQERSRPTQYPGRRGQGMRRGINGYESQEDEFSGKKASPIAKMDSERGAAQSEYGPSISRQPSPVRSIMSLPDRSSKSAGGMGAWIGSGATDGGRLWSAIKELNLAKSRPRNSNL